MDYKELHSAFMDAYRRRQYAECFRMVDHFIDGATGKDLADALVLKASLILNTDYKRAAEGLSLVDEALEWAGQSSNLTMRSLTNALGLCYVLGDVTRAEHYEIIWNQLLQRHDSDPDLQTGRFRFHWNMGLIARLRSQHAAAYWHFVQSVHCLRTHGSEDPSEQPEYLFCLLLLVADACLSMRRWPEAEEALEEARKLIASPSNMIEHSITKAKWLRVTGRYDQADTCLQALPDLSTQDWGPELRAQYHLVAALLAADQGDLRSHHYHLNLAYQEAEANTLEYILSDIQRAQRVPMSMGVVER